MYMNKTVSAKMKILGKYGSHKVLDSDGSLDDIGVDEIKGDASEVEFVRNIRKSNNVSCNRFWRVEAKGLIASVINLTRYSVQWSRLEGSWVVIWLPKEKELHKARYYEAKSHVAKLGGRVLTNSRCSTRGKYGTSNCILRTRQWTQWHSAWIYGETPVVGMPQSMPLPPNMDVPIQFAQAQPTDIDDMGAEESRHQARYLNKGGASVGGYEPSTGLAPKRAKAKRRPNVKRKCGPKDKSDAVYPDGTSESSRDSENRDGNVPRQVSLARNAAQTSRAEISGFDSSMAASDPERQGEVLDSAFVAV